MEKKINIKAKKEIVLIFLSVFFISLVYALPLIPPLPDHFIGDALIDGQNASVGTQIEVYVNNTLEDTIITNIVGKYDLYVATGGSGDVIEFKISDILAGSSTRQGGETIILDLSITTTTPPSSGSSGGGGGGSGGSGTGESGGGFVNPPPATINESISDTLENETQEQESEDREVSVKPRVTGAVVGFLGSGGGIIVIIILFVLGIGVMLIKYKNPKWKKNY